MRTLLAAILAVTCGWPGGTAWSAVFACQMTGEVSAECCCEAPEADSCATIAVACTCCEVQFHEAPASGSNVPLPEASLETRVVVPEWSVSGETSIAPQTLTLGVHRDTSPRRHGPPLFVLNQSIVR